MRRVRLTALFACLWAGGRLLFECSTLALLDAPANLGPTVPAMLAAVAVGVLAGVALLAALERSALDGVRRRMSAAACAVAFAGGAALCRAALATGGAWMWVVSWGCLGCALAAALELWLRIFASLDLRTALACTASAAFIGVLVSLLLLAAPTPAGVLVLLALLGVGCLGGFLLRPGLTDAGSETTASDIPDDAAAPEGLFSRAGILLSVPVLGVALFAYTNGCCALNELEDWPGLATRVAMLAVLAAVALGARLGRVRRVPDHELAFSLFRVGLPILASAALSMKVIPVALIGEDLFREAMNLLFQLALVGAWALLAYARRAARRSPARLLAALLVPAAVALVVGTSTAGFESDWRRGIMGVVTSAFLLYSCVSLGKALIDYHKPVDIDETPAAPAPEQLDAVCGRVGAACGLSPRENEVLRELARGHSSSYIAAAFCISSNTARSHMKRIYKKLGVTSREELLEVIWREGA